MIQQIRREVNLVKHYGFWKRTEGSLNATQNAKRFVSGISTLVVNPGKPTINRPYSVWEIYVSKRSSVLCKL
jgi:hypothetical protein